MDHTNLITGQAFIIRIKLLGKELGFSFKTISDFVKVGEFDGVAELLEIVDLLRFGVDSSVFVQRHAKGHVLHLSSHFAFDRRRRQAVGKGSTHYQSDHNKLDS